VTNGNPNVQPVANCRHAAGYTQETFAETLGVDRTTVGRRERGKVNIPRLATKRQNNAL
jgi:DNA-binding XRE family transcriptional regulator